MREIKFRAWDKKRGKFHWGISNICLTLGGNLMWQFGENSPGFLDAEESKNYMLQQFSGLRDKNDKEIYEGDIVQYEGEYFKETADVVWYGTGSWGLHDREKYLDELIFSQAIRYDSLSGKPIYTEVEVIGNIYETPELLTPAKV